MKKATSARTDELRPEYDFASMKGGVRGKYARRARLGTNIVLIQPEVAEAFPTEQAVNEALKRMFNTTRAVQNAGGCGPPVADGPRSSSQPGCEDIASR